MDARRQKRTGHSDFWKQFATIVLGTTLSILLTVGSSQLLQRRQRANDRRLSALMVMSNIENFARILEDGFEYLDRADTVSTWLLNLSTEEMEAMNQDTLGSLLNEVIYMPMMSYDKTAESIFSNDIETWKNMGNFQFIDNVGRCFSEMRITQEYWNDISDELDHAIDEINYHPEQFPGNTLKTKYLQNRRIRQLLGNIHNLGCWLHYTIERVRYYNLQNMAAINISEQEVLDFIELRQQEIAIDKEIPYPNYTPEINPDSITTIYRNL